MTAGHAEVESLRPTKRDPLRVMVRVGGRVVGTLPRDAVERLGIAIGTPWSDELAGALAQAVSADKARRYALNALGRRMLSCGELAERMRRRAYEPAVVESVIGQLVERGVLDDEAYGRAVIRAERERKPAGGRLLRHKLFQKKLPRELVDRLIAEAEADHDAPAALRALLERRLQTTAMQKLEPAVRRRRLWGLAARRGFNPDDIRAAMSDIVALDEPNDKSFE